MSTQKLQGLSVLNNLGQRIVPNIHVGAYNGYPSGDILDANSVKKLLDDASPEGDISELKSDVSDLKTSAQTASTDITNLRTDVNNIQDLIDGEGTDIDDVINRYEEIVDFLDGIEPGSILDNIIKSHIDNGQTKQIKHVEVMTQSEYDALASKDTNTEYNVI